MAPGLEQELGCLLRTLGLRSPSIGGVSGRESRPIGETGAGLRSDSGPHWGRPLRTWEPDEDRSGQAACPPLLPLPRTGRRAARGRNSSAARPVIKNVAFSYLGVTYH